MSILEEIRRDKTYVDEKYTIASKNFWEYCKIINPKFFKESRWHLKRTANDLQALYEGRIIKYVDNEPWKIVDSLEGLPEHITCKNMMLNEPPRHGKSYMLTLFSQWVLGKDNENRIITTSYNETLSGRFAKGVRDGIDATKIDNRLNIFSDVFPATKIKQGDAATQIWALEGQFFNYLATSFNGTVTGVGCNIGIIDDQIKTAAEANNENLLNNQWSWYTDTFLSRLEEGAIQIIVMTRWSTKDICGRLRDEPDAHMWYVLELKACLDESKGEMLCPELLSFASYLFKKGKISLQIILANYQQEPVDVQGRLYNELLTYTDFPKDGNGKVVFERIISYTDTADTGADYLCSIVAGVFKGEGWIIDILYSQEPMEKTEPGTAKLFHENKVSLAKIESNNGGRGFARNVEKILWDKFSTRKVKIEWFHQSENKISRILTNSSFVTSHLYFPVNWKDKWPEYYKTMTTYQREGKNKHDDAPDATTGIAEMIQNGTKKFKFTWA